MYTKTVGKSVSVCMLGAYALLTGCEQQSAAELERLNRLDERLTQVERQIQSLEIEKAQAASARPPAQPIPVEIKPRYSHQLVGASFKGDAERLYTSEQKCEEARQALLETWAEDDERQRQRGVVFTSRPTPVCLPI